MKPQNRRAFTLIELLVVIAILGILAAMLFPVFGRARENGRRAACQSNLKQIGLGLLQYSQDYDEVLIADWYSSTVASPGDTWAPGQGETHYKWMDAAFPYIKNTQVFTCPSATGDRAKPFIYYENLPAGTQDYKLYGSYVITHGYGANQPDKTPPVSHPNVSPAQLVSLAAVGDATGTAWVADGNDNVTTDNNVTFSQDVSGSELKNFSTLHLETVNVLFLDGHVKALKEAALQQQNSSGVIKAVTIQDD